jgi:hypothetical protein
MAITTTYGIFDGNAGSVRPYSASTLGPEPAGRYGPLSTNSQVLSYTASVAGPPVQATYGPILARPQVFQYRGRLESTPIAADSILTFGSYRKCN